MCRINDNESCAELLMERLSKSEVTSADDNGRTAIHAAAFNDNGECLQLLLRRTDSADMADNLGQTPLMIAARHGHSSTVGELTV